MIFDLSSNPRRKAVVRVVFGFLAVIFAVGFIGFGIGGEIGQGGIADIFTGGGNSSTSEQFETQIEDAEKALESAPDDSRALATLAQYRALSGTAQLEVDEATGFPIALTEDSRQEYEAAIEAWNRYVATEPKRIDETAASGVIQAYGYLGDFDGAAKAAAVVAESNPDQVNLQTLALAEYQRFEFDAGDKAAKRAVELAKPDDRKQLQQTLEAQRKQAVKFEKQEKKAAKAAPEGGELDDPFSGLDPAGGVGGAAPVAP